MEIKRLIYMANQIGTFFASQGQELAVSGVEDHLRKFWEPRMRTQLVDYWRKGGKGLEPCVSAAVARLSD